MQARLLSAAAGPSRLALRQQQRRPGAAHCAGPRPGVLPGRPQRNGCRQEQEVQRGDAQVCGGAVAPGPGEAYNNYPPPPTPSSYAPTTFGGSMAGGGLSEPARAALLRASSAMRRYGWLAFWIQLSLSVVSGVILLFSVAFTSPSGPKASLYLTLVGILAGFLSTFWAYGYQRIAMRMQEYLDGADVAKIKKQQVIENITRGVLINCVGMGSTLLGISTLVGLLVAKTLSNASINPFLAGAAGYNPVLALDVFLVQAATNTLLGHFLSLICSLWLLNVIAEGRGLAFSQRKLREDDVTGVSMSGSTYRIGGSGGSGGGAPGGVSSGGVAGAWPWPRAS